LRAAELLSRESIEVEVIDPRTVAPLDMATICESVAKTQRLVVADPGWELVGVAGEIIAQVCMRMSRQLLANPARVTLPQSHTPMSARLEAAYYPDYNVIAERIRRSIRSY
jgi:pyruvate dehydrogenase E1 component beta subunit